MFILHFIVIGMGRPFLIGCTNKVIIIIIIIIIIIDYLQRYSSCFVETELRKSAYYLLNFPVSSLSSVENNYGKSNCKW